MSRRGGAKQSRLLFCGLVFVSLATLQLQRPAGEDVDTDGCNNRWPLRLTLPCFFFLFVSSPPHNLKEVIGFWFFLRNLEERDWIAVAVHTQAAGGVGCHRGVFLPSLL